MEEMIDDKIKMTMPQSNTRHSICNGEIMFFEGKDGVQFATQPKNRRKSTCGGDDLNVVNVTWENMDAFISKITDIENRHIIDEVRKL